MVQNNAINKTDIRDAVCKTLRGTGNYHPFGIERRIEIFFLNTEHLQYWKKFARQERKAY